MMSLLMTAPEATTHTEGYLVIREQRATLSALGPLERVGAEQVAVLAQMEGETYQSFAARVLSRVTRDRQQGQGLRGASISIELGSSPAVIAARSQLVRRLAEQLARRPNSELVISAPSQIGPSERLGLFELVDSTLRAVPMLKVRLTFSDAAKKPYSRQKLARRSSTSATA
jgi:hypothetical protein